MPTIATSDHAALRLAAESDAALATIVGIDGSFSRRCGAQLAILPAGRTAGDMADNCLDAELVRQAAAARAEGTARLLRYGQGSPFIDFRLPCGAGLDILLEPQPDRAALAKAVARLAARQPAAYPLTYPQDAAPGLLAERRYVPELRLVLLGAGPECAALRVLAEAQGIAVDWREAGRGMALNQVPQGLAADPWSAVLLLFHDHEWEHSLLDWALGTPAFLIGAQGGEPARRARIERLRTAGHDDAALARIVSPVGLVPRARDAGVLALSVLAQIVGAYEALHPHQ